MASDANPVSSTTDAGDVRSVAAKLTAPGTSLFNPAMGGDALPYKSNWVIKAATGRFAQSGPHYYVESESRSQQAKNREVMYLDTESCAPFKQPEGLRDGVDALILARGFDPTLDPHGDVENGDLPHYALKHGNAYWSIPGSYPYAYVDRLVSKEADISRYVKAVCSNPNRRPLLDRYLAYVAAARVYVERGLPDEFTAEEVTLCLEGLRPGYSRLLYRFLTPANLQKIVVEHTLVSRADALKALEHVRPITPIAARFYGFCCEQLELRRQRCVTQCRLYWLAKIEADDYLLYTTMAQDVEDVAGTDTEDLACARTCTT